MNTDELIKELQKYPVSEVWCGAWNGYVNTYAVVDHVFQFKYGAVSNDFFGTPGRMDGRVLGKRDDEEEIIYLGTKFGRIPNKKIDFGDDFIDYPIKTLNGEQGDPELVFKLNHFTHVQPGRWRLEKQGEWRIEYIMDTDTLMIDNTRDSIRYEGKVIGIDTLRNTLEICKIDTQIWT